MSADDSLVETRSEATPSFSLIRTVTKRRPERGAPSDSETTHPRFGFRRAARAPANRGDDRTRLAASRYFPILPVWRAVPYSLGGGSMPKSWIAEWSTRGGRRRL